MKLKHVFFALAVLSFAVDIAEANQIQIKQTHNFNYTQSITPGTGTVSLPGSKFIASMSPFTGNPNSLLSYTIDWDITSAFSGVTGSEGSGNSSVSIGGGYYVEGSNYNGNGGGGGDNNSASTAISYSVTVGNSSTFLPANANVTYDPAILAYVIGSSNFNLKWNTDAAFSWTNLASGDASATGSVTLTYNVIPEPETLPLMLVGGVSLLGLLGKRKASS